MHTENRTKKGLLPSHWPGKPQENITDVDEDILNLSKSLISNTREIAEVKRYFQRMKLLIFGLLGITWVVGGLVIFYITKDSNLLFATPTPTDINTISDSGTTIAHPQYISTPSSTPWESASSVLQVDYPKVLPVNQVGYMVLTLGDSTGIQPNQQIHVYVTAGTKLIDLEPSGEVITNANGIALVKIIPTGIPGTVVLNVSSQNIIREVDIILLEN